MLVVADREECIKGRQRVKRRIDEEEEEEEEFMD